MVIHPIFILLHVLTSHISELWYTRLGKIEYVKIKKPITVYSNVSRWLREEQALSFLFNDRQVLIDVCLPQRVWISDNTAISIHLFIQNNHLRQHVSHMLGVYPIWQYDWIAKWSKIETNKTDRKQNKDNSYKFKSRMVAAFDAQRTRWADNDHSTTGKEKKKKKGRSFWRMEWIAKWVFDWSTKGTEHFVLCPSLYPFSKVSKKTSRTMC